MKLSDAIALGRTLLKPRAYVTILDDEGCALGMAMAALGAKNHEEALKVCRESGWKWPNKRYASLPCGCRKDCGGSKSGTYHAALVHLFNEHVCGKRDWTLDQLIDWVRSVEPAESEAPAGQLEALRESEYDASANTR